MESKPFINSENWTFAGYKTSNLLAFIHLGAIPGDDLGDQAKNEAKLLYLVTVLKDLEDEVFQREHLSLENAIDDINTRYREWDFFDRTNPSGDGGGCGSCAAH